MGKLNPSLNLAVMFVGFAAVLALVLILGVSAAHAQDAVTATTGGATLPPEVQGLLPIPGVALGLGVGWLVWGRSQSVEEAQHRAEERQIVTAVARLEVQIGSLADKVERIDDEVGRVRDLLDQPKRRVPA